MNQPRQSYCGGRIDGQGPSLVSFHVLIVRSCQSARTFLLLHSIPIEPHYPPLQYQPMITPAHRSPLTYTSSPFASYKARAEPSRTPDMAHMSDLLQDSKLETQFYSDPEYTQHVQYVSGSTTRQRKVRKEEKWMRERGLGRGSFGIVWLERCIQGDSEGKVRAVKKVEKLKSSNYYRELEAIALFSHSKVSRLLLSIHNHIFCVLR